MDTRACDRTCGKDVGGHGSPGNLFIVSAPSGAGKSTLCDALRKRFHRIRYSISYTTRSPRPLETDGVDYHFIDRKAFLERIEENCWAEWAEVHGNYYGTSAELLRQSLGGGEDILLEIDVQGAEQIVSRFPSSVSIFIMPPSIAALEERLKGRDSDSPEVISKRIENAKGEMARRDRYRHVIVNDDLSVATAELFDVVAGYLGGAGRS